jgi:putative chitinase
MIKLKNILLEQVYTKDQSSVEYIQTLLDKMNFDIGSNGIDGIYGPDTKQAVKDFQTSYGGLKSDGIVGDKTLNALNQAKQDLNIMLPVPPSLISKGIKISKADSIPDESDISEFDISAPVNIGGSYPKPAVRLVEKAMDEYGITNPYTRIAILSVIAKESGFVPKSETAYRNTSNARIRKIFGKRVPADDDELTKLKADDKAFFDKVYGGRYDNANDEGYKYRGRGFNQLTFKSAYKIYSTLIGKDLISNPDSVNEPKIAALIAVMFLKRRLRSKYGTDLGDFNNQKEANTAVANANAGWGKKRGHSGLERAIGSTNLASAKFSYPNSTDQNLASL